MEIVDIFCDVCIVFYISSNYSSLLKFSTYSCKFIKNR